MFGCRWYAFLLTHCKYTTRIMLSLRRSSWCYWSAVDCDGRATVVEVGWRRCCLEDCWECCSSLVLTKGRAVKWSLMKIESWSGWFPLKSSPTCSCRWLHYDLQNVPREHPNCTARTQRANWSESSSWLKRLPRIFLLLSCYQIATEVTVTQTSIEATTW
jgi:hypothetical protein